MTARLTSAMLASALVRRVHDAGGSAMILAKGDATAGALLTLILERGTNPRFLERRIGPEGEPMVLAAGPAEFADDAAVSAYWQRRRSFDADLWVIELDIAEAERFVAETIGSG